VGGEGFSPRLFPSFFSQSGKEGGEASTIPAKKKKKRREIGLFFLSFFSTKPYRVKGEKGRRKKE